MSIALLILDNDTNTPLFQDSMDVTGMTIESFVKHVNKSWNLISVFLVNDGTEVLDMTKEKADMFVSDLYDTYEFEMEMNELWIEVKVGKIPKNDINIGGF